MMADGTHIEWTEATWNPITGCSLASPGCTNCYAMQLAGTRLAHIPSRAGLTRAAKHGAGFRPVWTGEVRFNEEFLTQPLRWKRPRMIFVCAHGDLFHESVPDEWIDRIFAVMALCPQHTFQVLTKRSARMREYLSNPLRAGIVQTVVDNWECEDDCPFGDAHAPWVIDPWPLPNVWLGVSVEDQLRADERIPDLLATPAAVRWISAEPLLGPVDLGVAWHGESALDSYCWGDCAWCENGHPPLTNCHLGRQSEAEHLKDRSGLDWVVVGGESGPKARPMHPDWARALRDQCAAAGVPFFFKQWGEWELSLDRDRDDPDWRADYSNDYVDRGKSKWLNLAGGCGFHGERFVVMRKVGKKRAGRLLDGVEHNEMPERRA